MRNCVPEDEIEVDKWQVPLFGDEIEVNHFMKLNAILAKMNRKTYVKFCTL